MRETALNGGKTPPRRWALRLLVGLPVAFVLLLGISVLLTPPGQR